MKWTSNDLRIEMSNTKAAKTTIETIKRYVTDCGNGYDTLDADTLIADLHSEKSAVVLDGSFAMCGQDYLAFIPCICKLIAEDVSARAFNGEAFFCSSYGDEGVVEFSFENSELCIKTTYYPEGYSENLYCEECGEEVVRYDEYEPGKIYTCPECGEVVDMAEEYKRYTPEITEVILRIG